MLADRPVRRRLRVSATCSRKNTLLEWRTVLQNALIGAELLGLDKAKARKRAEGLLVRYGLGEFMHALPSSFPAGCANAPRSRATLCPEPKSCCSTSRFSALDFQTRLHCRRGRRNPAQRGQDRDSSSPTTSAKPSRWRAA